MNLTVHDLRKKSLGELENYRRILKKRWLQATALETKKIVQTQTQRTEKVIIEKYLKGKKKIQLSTAQYLKLHHGQQIRITREGIVYYIEVTSFGVSITDMAGDEYRDMVLMYDDEILDSYIRNW